MKATTDLTFYHLNDDGCWETIETASENEGYVRIPEPGQHIQVGDSDQVYTVQRRLFRYRKVNYQSTTEREFVTVVEVYMY